MAKPRTLNAREVRLIAELIDVDREIAHLQRRRGDLATLIMRERVDEFVEADRIRKLTAKWRPPKRKSG